MSGRWLTGAVALVVVVAAGLTAAWMAAPGWTVLGGWVLPGAGWPGRPYVAAATVAVAGVAAGWAGAHLERRRERWSAAGTDVARREPDPQPEPTPAPEPAGVPAAPVVAADDPLVDSVIGVRDLLGSEVLSRRLGAGLAAVGVETDDPGGARFDPAVHHAVESTPTDDQALVGTIASVERFGYRRHGHQLRPAEVVVYRGAP